MAFTLHEDRERDDHEVDDALDEFTVGQHHGRGVVQGRFEGDCQVPEVHPADQQAMGGM